MAVIVSMPACRCLALVVIILFSDCASVVGSLRKVVVVLCFGVRWGNVFLHGSTP